MDDFELVAPPSDVKPVDSRSSTKDLYDQWIKYSESHGADHPFTTEAHNKFKAAREAEKRKVV